MKVSKLPSLVLAVALQVVPISRVFIASSPATGSSFAIISTWIAGAFALLGGYDVVSGASSISITPTTATTGVPYLGAVQYSGSHASSAKSWELRNNWSGAKSGCNSVYEIAPGLWLTNASTYLARVGGTPTASGTFSFTLRIWSGSGCSGGDNDTRSASITINAGSATAPTITTQPVGRTAAAGANVSFSVTANGTAPLNYQWRLNGANLSGATNSTLALTSVTANQAGNYTVVVNNSAGSVTSSPALLTVTPVNTAPAISAIANQIISASTSTVPASFSVSDVETPAANLILSVVSSSTTLIPASNIVLGGSGANRTVTLTPVAGQTGTATITITVSDGSATASTSFQLVVQSARPPPPTNLIIIGAHGVGTISPNIYAQALDQGKTYTITAVSG